MKCNFKDLNEAREKVYNFLKEHGDGLPEDALKKATETKMFSNFAIECDNQGEISSLATYENNDWFLCTIRYLATRPDQRGKGLGKKVVDEVMKKTEADDKCLVMAADITHDNEPSKNIFKKHGFTETNRFCWGTNQKSADIMHLVRFPEEDGKCKKALF